MSKKKKPRNKAYRPKPAAAGGGLMALVRVEDRALRREALMRPYSAEDVAELSNTYWDAFIQLKVGAAPLEAWEVVTASMNMALLLAEEGLGEECVPEIVPAQEAMVRAHVRGVKYGSYRLDGPGLAAVENALRIHDAQMDQATPADLIAADAELKKRTRNGDVYSVESIH